MNRKITIENKTVNDASNCYVIAEIGHNHMGKLDVCKEMFRVAKECGADAVKLQKRDNKSIYTKDLYDQLYDNPNSYGTTYGEHREALEFGLPEFKELQAYSKEIGITFFATAFDLNSTDFLQSLDMPLYKVASCDLKNTPLLKRIAQAKKPMILSTGGGTVDDVRRALEAINPINKQVAVLQCTAAYPCDFSELNLRVIETLREEFPDNVIGLSDHDNGIAMSVAAYVLGARIIEKHFTLNRANRGTDHAFSLEPIGLRKMVRDLKRTRLALGDGVKRQYPSETKPLAKMSKALYAAKDLRAGSVLTMESIAFKSPGDKGLPPYHLEFYLGKTLTLDISEDDFFTKEHFA
jgi:sialic acid synthase